MTHTKRIVTTRVGSLVRPAELVELLRRQTAGESISTEVLAACIDRGVEEVVRHQASVGIDVVSDGEFGKPISWSQYISTRLVGLEPRSKALAWPPGSSGAGLRSEGCGGRRVLLEELPALVALRSHVGLHDQLRRPLRPGRARVRSRSISVCKGSEKADALGQARAANCAAAQLPRAAAVSLIMAAPG